MSFEQTTPAPAPAPQNAQAPTQTPAPAAEELTAEEQQVNAAAETKRLELMREIALDPALTQQYAQQQFYPQQQLPAFQQPQFQQPQYQPQTQYQQPQEQEFQLPFDEFTYDSTNPEHQQALIAAQLHQIGGPLFQKIDQISQRFSQQEAQQQAAQQQQAAAYANQKTVEFLDTYVPGFAGIAQKVIDKQPWDAKEEAIFSMAVNMESLFFQQFPQAMNDVQARALIAQNIGPILQQKAKELGLVSQPRPQQLTPEVQQQMRQEMYVESSNAVPAANATNFDKARAKGDALSMISELRRK